MTDQELLKAIKSILNQIKSDVSPIRSVKSNTTDTNTKLDTMQASLALIDTQTAAIQTATEATKEATEKSEAEAEATTDALESINAKLTNGSGTTALKTIDYPHHEIHSGNHFFYSDYDSDVDTGAPKYYLIRTPDTTKWGHPTFTLYSEGVGTWQLFENPTVNVSGIEATTFNSNRNSANTAGLIIATDPTSGGDGTLMKVWRTGSGTSAPTRVGSTSRDDEEIILKQNEDYFVKFTPDSDNAKTKFEINWYEHTDV